MNSLIPTDHLQQLEEKARQLESTPEQRMDWNGQMHRYTERFYSGLPTERVFTPEKGQSKVVLKAEIQEEGRSLETLLDLFEEGVEKGGINAASGGHLGYIPGGGLYPTALGDYLAAVTNKYVGMWFASPGGVRMENQLLRWMCKMVEYPEGAMGNLTSGGSIANLSAIIAAREHFQLEGEKTERAVVYLTPQVHHCVQKALRIAGLGKTIIRYIEMDERFRMKADNLQQQLKKDQAAGLVPFLLVASAGTTDTGAIDPLEELADIAEKEQLWFHVDAAYGGFFLLVESLRQKFRGIERSHSVTIDPHKGFFLSYGLGAVLVREVAPLFNANHYTASYLQDALDAMDELSPSDLSPELTKHFRALRMWLPLQLYGVAPFRAALEEKALLTHYFYDQLSNMPGFELGPEPELSVMIFRYTDTENPNAFNKAIIQFIQDDGRVFLTSTTIKGVFWIRLAVLSFRTHREHINTTLTVLREAVLSQTRSDAV